MGSSLDRCCDKPHVDEAEQHAFHVHGDEGEEPLAGPEGVSDFKDEPSTPPAGRGSVHYEDVEVPLVDVPVTLHNTTLLKRARFISIDMRVMFSHDCDYVHPKTGEKRTMALEKYAFHGESSRKVITAPHTASPTASMTTRASMVASPTATQAALEIVGRAKDMAEATAREPDDMTHDDWVGPNGVDALEALLQPRSREGLYKSIESLITSVLAMLKDEPIVSHTPAPAKVYGDLHGQFRDMLLYLHHYGFPSMLGPSYIFNGDWVDRGQHQIETIALVYALKLAFPERVFLVRGNHEDSSVNEHMGKAGFHHALKGTFGPTEGLNLWGLFTKSFEWLPLAVLIGDRLLVVHGGIGTGQWTIEALEKQKRPITHENMKKNETVYNILWSDPIDEDRPDSFGVHESPRDHNAGTLHQFGKDITEQFCEANKIAMVIRSHQSERKGAGYEIMHGGLVVTVFSARDYEGNKNDGAILSVEVYHGEEEGAGVVDASKSMLVVRPQQIWSHMKKMHITIEQ